MFSPSCFFPHDLPLEYRQVNIPPGRDILWNTMEDYNSEKQNLSFKAVKITYVQF